MSEDDSVNEVIETLEEAGFEVTSGVPGHGTCERCGIQDKESRMGACFVCGMWEDPSSTDRDLRMGTEAAYEYGHTLQMWLAGRKNWGKLYPPPELIERIWRDIINHADEERTKLNNWLSANTKPK
jgi:hypothetical protein